MLGSSSRLVLSLVNLIVTSKHMIVYIVGGLHDCDVNYQFIALILHDSYHVLKYYNNGELLRPRIFGICG